MVLHCSNLERWTVTIQNVTFYTGPVIIKCPSSSFLVSKALVPNTKKGCISFTDNRRNFQHLLPLGVLSSSPPMLLSDPPVSPVCRTYWGPLKPDIYTQSNIYKPKRTYSLIKEKKKKSRYFTLQPDVIISEEEKLFRRCRLSVITNVSSYIIQLIHQVRQSTGAPTIFYR